jgi:hypothetical protein
VSIVVWVTSVPVTVVPCWLVTEVPGPVRVSFNEKFTMVMSGVDELVLLLVVFVVLLVLLVLLVVTVLPLLVVVVVLLVVGVLLVEVLLELLLELLLEVLLEVLLERLSSSEWGGVLLLLSAIHCT